MIAGSHSVSRFSFVRNCHTVFQSGCTILHSQQQCMSVPIGPHPHQRLVFVSYFHILRDVSWYVFPQTSLVAQMVKYLPTVQETWVQSLSWEDLLEKEMATHSSVLS